MKSDVLPWSDGETTPIEWSNLLIWTVLIAAGLLVFELTAQPALSVPILGLKFGWEDFLTACWFRRSDPYHRRGCVHFWLFVAAGLLKAALTAAIMLIPIFSLLVFFGQPNRPGNAPLLLHFVAALVTTFGGIGLAGAAALATSIVALRNGIQVWLEVRLHHARRENTWPPTCGDVNEAYGVLMTAVIPIFLLASGLVLGSVTLLHLSLQGCDVGLQVFLGAAATAIILAAATNAAVRYKRAIEQRVIAKKHADCWRAEDPANVLVI